MADHSNNEQDIAWPNNAAGYDVLHKIGQGASAVVYHAVCKTNHKEVAIKVIDLEGFELDEIRKEIAQMKLCNHPNVIPFYCSFVEDKFLWLIMEFQSGGSILDVMKYSYPNGLSDEILIATILKEALHGIEYLHATGNIHRDVKAGNMLISDSGRVKIADFGVSAHLIESGLRREKKTTFVGTPCWMAPEVMEQVSGYDYKADIWSLGITALELANGSAPLAQYPPMKVLLLTLQNPPPSLDDSFSRPFRDFCDCCLQKDPEKRPTATKLLEHKFLRQAKKPDYIVNTLMKKLPVLWERVKVTKQEGDLSLKIAHNSNQPQQQQQQLNITRQESDDGWEFPKSGTSDMKQVAQNAIRGVAQEEKKRSKSINDGTKTKGRFKIKQVEDRNKTKPQSRSFRSSIPNSPIDLLKELENQVRHLMTENNQLKAENAKLKQQLSFQST